MKPGIYYDMPYAEYHAIRALSQSGMKHLAISPLRYWYKNIHRPNADEPTRPMVLGSALHCAVLEGDQAFEDRYARAIDPDEYEDTLRTVPEIREWVKSKGKESKGSTKEAVVAHAKNVMEELGEYRPILHDIERRFYAQNHGKVILDLDEWKRVAGMTQALKREPALQPILARGRPEVTIITQDPETKVPLKMRLDWWAPKHTVDLKSFTQTRGKTIDKSVTDAIYYEKYWIQAYFYDLGRRTAEGAQHEAFETVYPFVESDEPYDVRIRSFRPKAAGEVNMYWEQARIETRGLIRMYADCVKHFGYDKPWRFDQDVDPLTNEDLKQFAYS